MSTAQEPADLAGVATTGRPFLGWRVVAGAFTSQLFSAGLCFSAFGAFIVPLAESFGTTRGAISGGLGIGMVWMALLGPPVGRVADRGPVRALVVSGLLLMGAGLHLASVAAELWQAAFAFCLLVCTGAAMTGPIPTISLVGKWFVRRRGMALGITVAGATVASMAGPAVGAYLTELQGWRAALRSMGSFGPLIGVPLLWWLVVRRPEDVGQRPDGDPAPQVVDPTSGAPEDIRATGEFLRDSNVWLAGFGFAFLFASPVVMSIHVIPFAGDLGIDAVRASGFFAAMAPCSLLGKLVFGAVVDRVNARHALYAAMIVLALSWWLLLSSPGYNRLLLTGAVFGLGVGAVGPLQGIVIASCFGRDSVGRVMGIGGLLGLPIVAGAPPLVGFLFDVQGSYRMGFTLQLATLVISALLFSLLRFPSVEPGTELARSTPAPENA